MKRKRRLSWTFIFSLALVGYVTFTLLDAFVIPHDTVTLSSLQAQKADGESTTPDEDTSSVDHADAGSENSENEHHRPKGDGTKKVYAEGSKEKKPSGKGSGKGSGSHKKGSNSDEDESAVSVSDAAPAETGTDSYSADGITVTLTTKYVNDTYVYIADVVLDDTASLQSGLAKDTFGRNVSEKTSEIAERLNAVLAINGDYYGFRDDGYVIRNGYLYRDEAADGDQEDLVIYKDGTFEIIKESEITAQELLDKGALQVYSFGPSLVNDGAVTVSAGDEVDQSMTSNPRTAIGMVEAGHYVFVVSDGRTDESEVLSLAELASVMADAGCTVAYNLDGGGSTTMYFNGELVNKPTTNGNKISERSVSDIVYIG